jgi:2-dehydro-3-deoxyphosphogluconate aldolase / (4S)-4-hydroxy-2-oxoglutarate aldolase
MLQRVLQICCYFQQIKNLNMVTKQAVLDNIIAQGFLPLYFNKDVQVSIDLMKTLYRNGVKNLEYTNRGDDALNNFKAMKVVRDAELPEMMLGVGTIKNVKDAQAFIDAGADFLIGPGYEQGVADLANANNIFYAPGCMTPSEIITAENNGVQLIKLFPGNILGPEFMAAIKEVFRNLKFMPTGGVDLDLGNLSAWFTAGVCAVGMGSKLITKKIMEEKDYAGLELKIKQCFELIRGARK